jgi:hypothetical protein
MSTPILTQHTVDALFYGSIVVPARDPEHAARLLHDLEVEDGCGEFFHRNLVEIAVHAIDEVWPDGAVTPMRLASSTLTGLRAASAALEAAASSSGDERDAAAGALLAAVRAFLAVIP